MNTSDTPATDAVIRKAMESPTMTDAILAAKITLKCMELERAIRETIMENRHLADGDHCKLKKLKDAIKFEFPEDE